MVIDFKQCELEIRGGTTGQKMVVKFGNGNLTYQEKINREYILDRGNLDTIRNGDDVPLTVKFTGQYEYITGPGTVGANSLEDVLKQRGGASGWTTTSADTCEPYCVDLWFFNLNPCTQYQQETLVFPEFRYETLDHDAKASTISVDGKCNVISATATRGTATT